MAAQTYDSVIEGAGPRDSVRMWCKRPTRPIRCSGSSRPDVGVAVLASAYRARGGPDVVFVPIAGSESTLYLAWRSDEASAARDNVIAIAHRRRSARRS